jgi:predicted phosphodiesterase
MGQTREEKAAFRSAIDTVINRLDELTIQGAAREVVANFPGLFASQESARSAIRTRLGANGDRKRKNRTEPPQLSTIAEGLAKLKHQHTDRGRSVTLTGKVGILSDIHIPEQEIVPLRLAIETLKDVDVDAIVLNGDVMDMYGVTGFTKEIGRFTLQEEIQITQDFFAFLRQQFPNAIIEWKEGNHEQRLRRYLLTNARDLSDLKGLSIENLLRLDDFGIGYVKTERIMLGKLSVIHGHERRQGIAPSVNPARGLWLWGKTNLLCGHHHQTSEHAEGDLNGTQFGCWSTGCLCTLTPDYNPFGHVRQNHGFAVVQVDDDGAFEVHNHRIINGKVK